MRKAGFKYLITGMLMSWGLLKTSSALSSSNFCWSFRIWWWAHWVSLPFHWGHSKGPMFTLALNRPSENMSRMWSGKMSKMWSYIYKNDMNFLPLYLQEVVGCGHSWEAVSFLTLGASVQGSNAYTGVRRCIAWVMQLLETLQARLS